MGEKCNWQDQAQVEMQILDATSDLDQQLYPEISVLMTPGADAGTSVS